MNNVDEQVLKRVDSAEPGCTLGNVIDILEDTNELTATKVNSLYCFLKYCKIEGTMDSPICKQILKIVTEYERRCSL